MTRRQLQIALGCLWLLDGLFQLQPKMFTASFARDVVLPAASNQPLFVSGPIHWAVALFLLHPAIFNTLIVAVQLSIGALILSRRTVKIGLILSVLWGLFVWSIGEGYGGIFSGHFSLLMGAPGAALLYSLLSVGAYPDKKLKFPAPWLGLAWGFIWVVGALLLVVQQHAAGNLHDMLLANAQGAPSWLSSLDMRTAGMIGGSYHANFMGLTAKSAAMSAMGVGSSGSGYWLVLLLGLLELFIATGVFLRKSVKRIALLIGILLLVMFWIIGQNIGGYYSGLMTDLNTAPLMILLGLSLNSLDLKGYLEPTKQKFKKALI